MVFRGRENALKFCTTQKRTLKFTSILFSDTVLVPYREYKHYTYISILFPVNAKSA